MTTKHYEQLINEIDNDISYLKSRLEGQYKIWNKFRSENFDYQIYSKEMRLKYLIALRQELQNNYQSLLNYEKDREIRWKKFVKDWPKVMKKIKQIKIPEGEKVSITTPKQKKII